MRPLSHSPTGAPASGFMPLSRPTRPRSKTELRDELAAAKGPKPPEHIQVVQALPRDSAGKPRTEILQLVAMNQLDLIEPMMTSETDRAFLKSILELRKNLRDRFNFEAADLNSP